ncbi:MAG: protein translocase subunit SecD [gamma proteobacterium symbiont of Bathyaustriella thionipta]|nr:protein translocase subunit SecD [gamma proteobacterium symbiont of Bathyaustriella thionipta]
MNRYPLWKNVIVILVVLVSALYALPNIYDQDPSVEMSPLRGTVMDIPALQAQASEVLQKADIKLKAAGPRNGKLLLRFADPDQQLHAVDALSPVFSEKYTLALTTVPDLPGWLSSMNALPMFLGLDLRGGVHVVIDVDMDAAVTQAVGRYRDDLRDLLRKEKIRGARLSMLPNGVRATFKEVGKRDLAENKASEQFRSLKFDNGEEGGQAWFDALIPPAEMTALKRFALEQNITTLRNRVNQMGVSEPIIQQQGERRIVVQLPGVSDPSKIKEILQATATLEYRLVDTQHSVLDVVDGGPVPPASKLYKERNGKPILLKKRVIVTGNQITDAKSGLDSRSGSPAVFISLDAGGARRMMDMTTENVGQPMAVVFIEKRTVTREKDGKLIKVKVPVEEVISVANILEPFGARFQTTGLDSTEEARDLSLLLRAGALAAPIEIVEERTIGPSLGQDSIDQGFRSVMVGLLVVMIFMALYYRVFGLVADLALLINLLMIVAVLSMLQATLTLPGIAGIVLTVGMAVDANVLIFERIREEIAVGSTPQASIKAGYEKALSTIVDANITTLIAAVVLYSFGTGPIKGFAVTLFIGILSSMFTAIMGSRALINVIYGGRRVKRLSI